MDNKEIETIQELLQVMEESGDLRGFAIQGIAIDIVQDRLLADGVNTEGAYFLGCPMTPYLRDELEARGAMIFPVMSDLPYNPYRPFLYSKEELYDKFDPKNPLSYLDCLDAVILKHWRQDGGPEPTNLIHAMAQRMHDQSIGNALTEFLDMMKVERRGVVAIMGGHDMLRSDPAYFNVAKIAWLLSRKGFLMVSGGGPGAMEATHVGAWFSGRTEAELVKAVTILSGAPLYKDELWLSLAFQVMEEFPHGDDSKHFSVGVPTWLYGHEPPTPFASHIAKYFANSLREDGLVTIGTAGIIYAPGSAGTIQEIFQDVTQNHYLTTGRASAMVFYGSEYWTKTKPVYPLVKQLAQGKVYSTLLGLVDEIDDVVQWIENHPPLGEV